MFDIGSNISIKIAKWQWFRKCSLMLTHVCSSALYIETEKERKVYIETIFHWNTHDILYVARATPSRLLSFGGYVCNYSGKAFCFTDTSPIILYKRIQVSPFGLLLVRWLRQCVTKCICRSRPTNMYRRFRVNSDLLTLIIHPRACVSCSFFFFPILFQIHARCTLVSPSCFAGGTN